MRAWSQCTSVPAPRSTGIMTTWCSNTVRTANPSNDTCIDNVSNAFALRSDTHRVFDDANFVIVPKESQWDNALLVFCLCKRGSGKRLLCKCVADAGDIAFKIENTDITAFRALARSRSRSFARAKKRAVAEQPTNKSPHTCESLWTSADYDARRHISTSKRKRLPSIPIS